jgi:hypothetical protein
MICNCLLSGEGVGGYQSEWKMVYIGTRIALFPLKLLKFKKSPITFILCTFEIWFFPAVMLGCDN